MIAAGKRLKRRPALRHSAQRSRNRLHREGTYYLSFLPTNICRCLLFISFPSFPQLEVCAGKTEKDFVATPALLHKVVEKRLPYPELHQEWSELHFYTALRDMLENCGYNNFSWRDLYAPTKKRYQTQLSAILNLAKFREEQLELYGALTEPVSTDEFQCIFVNAPMNDGISALLFIP